MSSGLIQGQRESYSLYTQSSFLAEHRLQMGCSPPHLTWKRVSNGTREQRRAQRGWIHLASATRLAREGALLGGLDRRHVWPRASLRLRQTQTRSRSWSWSWSRERNCARMLNLTAPTCERRALGNSPRASKIRPHSEERGRLQSPARLRLQALHRLGVARGRLSACHFVSRRLMRHDSS